jgi:hypothetical protein
MQARESRPERRTLRRAGGVAVLTGVTVIAMAMPATASPVETDTSTGPVGAVNQQYEVGSVAASWAGPTGEATSIRGSLGVAQPMLHPEGGVPIF